MITENNAITFISKWKDKKEYLTNVKLFFHEIGWIKSLDENPEEYKKLFTFNVDKNVVHVYIDDKQPNSECSNIEWAEELLEAFEKEKDIESVYIIKNEITESIIANRTIDDSNIIKEYGNEFYLVHCKS